MLYIRIRGAAGDTGFVHVDTPDDDITHELTKAQEVQLLGVLLPFVLPFRDAAADGTETTLEGFTIEVAFTYDDEPSHVRRRARPRN